MSAVPQEQTGARWRLAGRTSWPIQFMLFSVFGGFVIQAVVSPCLCDIGSTKLLFGVIVDGLVLLRTLVAHRVREKGKGWIFYSALCLTSAAWIEAVAWLFGVSHLN
jgi:hypothetical protein